MLTEAIKSKMNIGLTENLLVDGIRLFLLVYLQRLYRLCALGPTVGIWY